MCPWTKDIWEPLPALTICSGSETEFDTDNIQSKETGATETEELNVSGLLGFFCFPPQYSISSSKPATLSYSSCMCLQCLAVCLAQRRFSISIWFILHFMNNYLNAWFPNVTPDLLYDFGQITAFYYGHTKFIF